MERETVISGYCRQLDGSRMVCVVAQGEMLTEADCQYEACPYAAGCPVAQKIRQFLTNQ